MSTIGTFETESLTSSLVELLQSQMPASQSSRAQDTFVWEGDVEGSQNTENSTLVPLSTPKPGTDLLLSLQTIQLKLDEQGIARGKEDVLQLAQNNKERHKEVMEAIQKAIAEMERAQKSGKIAKAFGWIAAAATLVAGALLMATPGGAVAGAIMIGLAVDQTVGMITGKSGLSELTAKIAEGLQKAGMKEPGNTIFATVLVAVILIVATAGAGYMGTASSSASKASTVASSSGKAASSASSTAGEAAAVASTAGKTGTAVSQWQMVLHQARNISVFVGGAAEFGGAGANIDSAVHVQEAEFSRADEARVRKVISQNKAYIENTIDHIKNLTQNSESTLGQMIDQVNQQEQTNQKLNRDMA